MTPPLLVIFRGLPCSGKSTLAAALARAEGMALVRVDTVEQALRDAEGGPDQIGPLGYAACAAVARENLKLGIDVNWYWRMEREDGVYGPPGNLFRLPEGARERLVDISVSGGIEWEASEHIFVSLLFTHSAPQAFIRATGPADAIDFIEATLQFDF